MADDTTTTVIELVVLKSVKLQKVELTLAAD